MSDVCPIVYAYPCRWDMPPARHRYLMEAVSRQAPVYFLNWPAMSGKWFEGRRPRAERVSEGVTVIHDAFGSRFARGARRLGRLAAMRDAAWMDELLCTLGVKDY